MRAANLTGRTFGRLRVLAMASPSNRGHTVAKCLCKCGKRKSIESRVMLSGDVRSCGCFRRERITKMNRTRDYNERRK